MFGDQPAWRRVAAPASLSVVVAAALVVVLALGFGHSREVVLQSYGEHERVVATSTSARLSDLDRRIAFAADQLVHRLVIDPADDEAAIEARVRSLWSEIFPSLGEELSVLRAHEFEVAVERGHAHHHPAPRDSAAHALACSACIGEGSTLPVDIALSPGDPNTRVVEIALPLSLVAERLAAAARVDARGDAIWWADQATGTLLGSPSSDYIGTDLRAAAMQCAPQMAPIFTDSGPRTGTLRYCWPDEHESIERVAGFARTPFLGMRTVVGVSTDVQLATASLSRALRFTVIAAAIVFSAALAFLVWLLATSRATLLRDRKQALESLSSLGNALEARDRYTRFHSENVGIYSAELGRRLGFGAARCEELRYSGLMHDIGKIGICDGLLNKPGQLDADERKEMERHPEIGEHILSNLSWAEGIACVAGCHHERMDGGGYPRGLAGDAIPEHARIVAVADVLDALLTDRPYRAAMAMDRALAIITEMSGPHLDPRVVNALLTDPESLVALGRGSRPAVSHTRLRAVAIV